MEKRGILLLGNTFAILGMLFTGVTDKDKMHHTSTMVMIGSGIFGLGFSMVTIPVMPEILEGIEEKYGSGKNYDEQQLFNNLAGYFVVC